MNRLFLLAFLLLSAPFASAQNLIFEDDFDGGVTTGWTEVYFETSNYTTPDPDEPQFSTSPTPISGSHVIHYFPLVGTNELRPVELIKEFETDLDEVVLDWWEYIVGDPDGAGPETGYPYPSTSQKLARIYFQDDSFPASQKDLSFVIGNAGDGGTNNDEVNFSFYCGQWGNSSLCNTDWAEKTGAVGHPENQWVNWRIHVKLNTPGLSDGFIKVSKNGALYLSRVDQNLRGTDTKGFSAFWVGGNYSMSSGTLPYSGHRYIDYIRVWDGEPVIESVSTCFIPGAFD